MQGGEHRVTQLAVLLSLTVSMDVLSNVTAVNYKSHVYCWKVEQKLPKEPLLLLPVNLLWKKPMAAWLLLCTRETNKLPYSIYNSCFVLFCIYACSHRHRVQSHNSRSWESVWAGMLFRSRAGLRLKREQWGPLEAGQLGRLWSRSPIEMCLFM